MERRAPHSSGKEAAELPGGLRERIRALVAPVAGSAEEAEAEAGRILEAALAQQPARAADLALAWAESRARGTPLAHLTGRHSFLGVELVTGRGVLAPREETEILARAVLEVLQETARREPGRELLVADLGCGAGNLSCAVAKALPDARVWASDITAAAVELTRRNVALNGLQGRVEACQGDLFASLENKGLEGNLDAVMMNPPYIPSVSLQKGRSARLLNHEPLEAFDGGPYGISIIRRLQQEAPAFLRPGGHLLFEFGTGQAEVVEALVKRNPALSLVRFARDAGGEARAAVLRKGEAG